MIVQPGVIKLSIRQPQITFFEKPIHDVLKQNVVLPVVEVVLESVGDVVVVTFPQLDTVVPLLMLNGSLCVEFSAEWC